MLPIANKTSRTRSRCAGGNSRTVPSDVRPGVCCQVQRDHYGDDRVTDRSQRSRQAPVTLPAIAAAPPTRRAAVRRRKELPARRIGLALLQTLQSGGQGRSQLANLLTDAGAIDQPMRPNAIASSVTTIASAQRGDMRRRAANGSASERSSIASKMLANTSSTISAANTISSSASAAKPIWPRCAWSLAAKGS